MRQIYIINKLNNCLSRLEYSAMFELDTHSSLLHGVYHEHKTLLPEVKKNTKLLLYVGVNAISICEEMLGLGYVGLSIPNVVKACKWLGSRQKAHVPLPDAIICDINIPPSSLRYLISSLQNNPNLKKIPFIFFGQEKLPNDKEKATTYKADDLFYKEYDPQDLTFRIEFVKKIKEAQIYKDRELRNKKGVDGFNFWKRSIDIVVSSLALTLLSPVFLIIALIIKLDSRGSVFYVSKRAGRNYKVFDFYKFRTMKVKADAELAALLDKYNIYNKENADANFVKFNNDPRITKVGKWLRKSSLDELPQLINVLKGDMSLVGNRPLPLYEASTLTKDGAAYRFLAPAGITGLWQVSKNQKSEITARERIMLDVNYARNGSIWKDFRIMLKTLPAMIQKEES